MLPLVIGERRREPRELLAPRVTPRDLQVHGVRLVEILDVSAHGLRCRLAQPVRPGRPGMLRVASGGRYVSVATFVLRCQVARVTRHGVQYDAAWLLDRGWPVE